MPRESMTPRERWQAVLTGRKPDRLPTDYWGTVEATEKLQRHLGCATRDEALQRLHVDYAVTVGPTYAGPPVPEEMDVFGCRYKHVDYGTGAYRECVHHPLAQFNSVAEIERSYRWPDPDWWDYSGLREHIHGQERRPLRGGGSEPFLTYKHLRGQEQAFIDLIAEPEMVHYCLDKLFGLAYENTRRIYEHIPGQVMVTYVAEDMGGQDELMFSVKHIREFLLPRMKRMIDLAHQAGAFVFHHNDGACRAILPDLIAAGVDVLNPVQWRCRGMAREGLVRDFGDRLVFHGAVDNQQTLPFGTVDDVRQEVIDNLRIFGKERYILAPCHNIQAVSPPQNVVAMYETAYENGWL